MTTARTRRRQPTNALKTRKPPLIEEQGLLTLREAAKLLGVDPSTVWRYARVGRPTRSGQQVYLRATDFGSRMFFAQDDLLAFGTDVANAQRRPATPSAL